MGVRRRLPAVAAAGLAVMAGCYLGEPPIETGVDANDTAAGDVDGDGDVDLVTTGEGGWSVLVNDGSAGIAVAAYPFGTSGRGDRVELADLEGDGDLDAVHTVLDHDAFAQRLEVGVNDGAGRFAAVPQPAWNWQSAQDVELGDVTGDGLVDLLVLHEPVNERVDVYPGDGLGAFAATSIDSVTGLATGALEVGDLDEDGDLDLANILVTIGPDDLPIDTLQRAVNDGTGQFGPWSSPTVVGHASGRLHEFTDVDGDGHLDAVVASRGQVTPQVPGDVTIHYGDGAGAFGSPERWVGPARGTIDVDDIDLADIDGDGTDDIVADTAEGALVVYRDPEVPSFEEREFGPRGPIEAADFDGDGKVDVAVGSAIFLNRLTGR